MKIIQLGLLLLSLSAFSFVFTFDGWIEYDFAQPADETKYGVIIPVMGGIFKASGGFRRDNIVIPPYSDFLWNNYWFWDDGFFSYSNQFLEFEIGVKRHSIGPGRIYKLFVEEKGFSYPSVHFNVKGIEKYFRVETLWGGIRLFEDGAKPAKAFNYRSLVFSPIKGFEMAYEESVLYLYRSFDPYYYFVPIPVPGIQEFFHLNAPWKSSYDDNSLIGGWIKYSKQNWEAYFELLIDDINMNRFLNPQGTQNPDKIAFLFGFSGSSGSVRVTYEIAGATAFTFQRTHAAKPYEYVFFEGSNLPIEMNMIGYRHGENNIACGLRFEYNENPLYLCLELENVMHGTRTPDQPWHGSSQPSGTHWLIGDLKSQISLRMRFAYSCYNLYHGIDKMTFGVRCGFIGDKPFVGADLSLLLNFRNF